MPYKADILSPRNLIVLASGVFILALVTTSISALRPNDSDGWGRDSFGTRADGFRAVYELLGELGSSVTRDVAPPRADAPVARTLVLLGPDPGLVRVNPVYLKSLLAWVERGGRLVVVPQDESSNFLERHRTRRSASEAESENVLAALGLAERIAIQSHPSRPADDDWSVFGEARPPRETVSLQTHGGAEEMVSLQSEVRRLSIPQGACATLDGDIAHFDDAITFQGGDGMDRLIAAVVKRGAGEVVVIAEPAIFSNRHIAEADNSVLATRVLSPSGEPVAFDEFYHGLSVRGNPLYLLTRPGYAAATVGILLVIAASTWRAAMFLGPPLADIEPSRRNIGEYLNAMGHFFSRGSDSSAFLLREIRDGVLRELCRAMRLPLETPSEAAIVAALQRRDPRRASELQAALAEADAALQQRRDGRGHSSRLTTIQRLTNCL